MDVRDVHLCEMQGKTAENVRIATKNSVHLDV